MLGTIAGVAVLAGCVGDVEDGNSGDSDENDSTDTVENESEETEEVAGIEAVDEESTEDEIVALIDEILEEEGIGTDAVGRHYDVLEIMYPATGETSEVVETEIETVADVYARAIDAGLTTDRLEASVPDPETGSVLDSFVRRRSRSRWSEHLSVYPGGEHESIGKLRTAGR